MCAMVKTCTWGVVIPPSLGIPHDGHINSTNRRMAISFMEKKQHVLTMARVKSPTIFWAVAPHLGLQFLEVLSIPGHRIRRAEPMLQESM
jgi:hypothetical protein